MEMALKINIIKPRMRVCLLHFKKDDYIFSGNLMFTMISEVILKKVHAK